MMTDEEYRMIGLAHAVNIAANDKNYRTPESVVKHAQIYADYLKGKS